MTDKYYHVLLEAVKRYGEESQLMMAVEEMSELTKEISKHYRGERNSDALAEEMADVYIMLGQMLIMFYNEDEVKEWIDKKVQRLERKLLIEKKMYDWHE